MKRTLIILLLAVVSMTGHAGPMKLEPAQQKKLNVFFSNFSEARVTGFAKGAVSDQAMLDFALRHLYLNSFKSLKPCKDEASVLATAAQVDTTTRKYFGKTLPKHAATSYSIPCADGDLFLFSQVESFDDQGNGWYKATGTIYSTGSGGVPDVHASPAAWKKTGEEVEVDGTFSALVKSEGDRYILVEYSPVVAPSAEPQGGADTQPAPNQALSEKGK